MAKELKRCPSPSAFGRAAGVARHPLITGCKKPIVAVDSCLLAVVIGTVVRSFTTEPGTPVRNVPAMNGHPWHRRTRRSIASSVSNVVNWRNMLARKACSIVGEQRSTSAGGYGHDEHSNVDSGTVIQLAVRTRRNGGCGCGRSRASACIDWNIRPRTSQGVTYSIYAPFERCAGTSGAPSTHLHH